jgi:regulator of cell morphogenesis and NO signaling
MSHKQIVISEPETPLTNRTVGELVAERPGRSRVFQSFNIDFCCQGGRTLREACERKGVSVGCVIEQLEAEAADPAAPQSNPAELPPTALIDHIVEQHHGFLRRELPRMHAMAERVAHVHGPHTRSLVAIFRTFVEAESELTSHMMKEEQILVPAIVALSQGERLTGTLDGPISCMIHEHDEVGNALARIRELSNDFQPPAEACNTYRALFAGLPDLEEDLHRHIHLENAVLFPTTQKLVEQQSNR